MRKLLAGLAIVGALGVAAPAGAQPADHCASARKVAFEGHCQKVRAFPHGPARSAARSAKDTCPPKRAVVIARVWDGGLAGPSLLWGYDCR